MKKLVTFLFLLTSILSFNVMAVEFSAFAMTEDNVCCKEKTPIGIGMNQTIAEDIFVDGFVRGGSGDVFAGVGLGVSIGDFNIGAGKQIEKYSDALKIQGNSISAKNQNWGSYLFAEYTLNDYFIRYSYVMNDFKLDGAWTDENDCGSGMCTSYSDSKSVDTNDHWLWVGFRF